MELSFVCMKEYQDSQSYTADLQQKDEEDKEEGEEESKIKQDPNPSVCCTFLQETHFTIKYRHYL